MLSETAEGLQNGLNSMFQYCQKLEIVCKYSKKIKVDFQESRNIETKFTLLTMVIMN